MVREKLRLSLDKVKDALESLVDRSGKLVDIVTHAGIAYMGYNALKHPMGALTGLLALRLAGSPNLASGAAGVATLTGLGLLNLVPPPGDPLPGHRGVEWTLARLQELGLWKPSIPISERPEEMITGKTYGGIYLEP